MSPSKRRSMETKDSELVGWPDSDDTLEIREFDKDEQMLLAQLPCSVSMRMGNVYCMLERSILKKYKMANKTLSETKLRRKVLEVYNKNPKRFDDKYKKWENSQKEGEYRSRYIRYGLYECHLELEHEDRYNETDAQSEVSNEAVVDNSNSEQIVYLDSPEGVNNRIAGEEVPDPSNEIIIETSNTEEEIPSLSMQYTPSESSESVVKTNRTKRIVKKRRLYTEELPDSESSYTTFTQNLVTNGITSTEE